MKKYINSPFLFLYKSQYSSVLSIFLRISGFALFFYSLVFILSFNNIFFSYNFVNFFFDLLYSYSSVLSYTIIFCIIFFSLYHFFIGIKYILSINIWNIKEFNIFLYIKRYYAITYSLVLFIFLSFSYFLLFG